MKLARVTSFVTLFFGALLWIFAPLARADMIPTDQVAPQGQAQTEREKVQAFVERASVQEKLKALGVQDTFLKSRVDSLTDEEVHLLAQKIDALPAGGELSTFEIILIVLLVAILVAVIA
jgi:uncharacterized protein DUF6627